jgi:succinate dehydrogenase/fumarate reductase-like Fe-S protein
LETEESLHTSAFKDDHHSGRRREMMEREKIRLKVFRFDPTADSRPIFQEYEVEKSEKMSVLSAVRQIYENLDGSLSFSGYFCYRKLCGLCQMKINGKNRLSCRTRVEDGMIIEPAPGYALIKDLAVDFSADKFKKS